MHLLSLVRLIRAAKVEVTLLKEGLGKGGGTKEAPQACLSGASSRDPLAYHFEWNAGEMILLKVATIIC